MKYLLIILLTFGLLGSILAQDTKIIVVAIGTKKMKCNSSTYDTHVGLAWWQGADYDTPIKGAKEDVRTKYPSSEEIFTVYDKGKYLVIISTDKKHETFGGATCDKLFYSVGIGLDANEALKKAKNKLPYGWKESDGYRTLVDRSIN
jgi:hypothetical protein